MFVYPPKRNVFPVVGSEMSLACARYVGNPRVKTCFHFGDDEQFEEGVAGVSVP